MDNKKANEMESEKIGKLILKYSATTFAALFFNAVYNIVDSLFVSRGVGDNAMGGVSIVFPFMIIQGAIAQTIGAGSASIVSRLLGKKENARAGEATANAMLAFYSSAIIISVIGFVFMEPILRLLGATDDIMIYARQYFIIILAGNVFSTGFSSIIRAEGKMTYALLIWLIPTGINIIADAVLIFGLKMGVRGAALGTVLCQFTSFLMSVIFFTKMSCQEFKSIKIKVKTILEIIGIGLPTLVQMGSLSIMTMALNKILSSVAGTMGINTFAYISKALTFGLVPINALSLATAPIIGYNYGAKNKGRINEAFSFSLILCLVYSIVAIIVTQLSAGSMIGIFTSDAQLIEYGEAGLKIISFALLFAPLPLLSGSFFQSIGKKAPAFLLNASTLIFIFPLAIILSNANGMNGVWQAFIPAYALAAALSAAVLFAHYRKYKY